MLLCPVDNHCPISEADVTEANAQVSLFTQQKLEYNCGTFDKNEPVYCLARTPINMKNVKELWMTVWSMDVSLIAMIDMKVISFSAGT